jgi:hypothetical protein
MCQWQARRDSERRAFHRPCSHNSVSLLCQHGTAATWQQIDDTPTRLNGHNQYCQIVCNPLYTIYQTSASKDRLRILDVLRGGAPRRFGLNAEALAYLDQVHLPQLTRLRLLELPWEQELDEATLEELLQRHLPQLSEQQGKWIRDALAVAAYHAQTEWPLVRLLLGDDAPQWNWLREELALCWVHEGRHYKKLTPGVRTQRAALDDFLEQFWAFYDELLADREQPSPAERLRLAAAFESLFATSTDYWALNERIAKTRAKKAALLLVLEHREFVAHEVFG